MRESRLWHVAFLETILIHGDPIIDLYFLPLLVLGTVQIDNVSASVRFLPVDEGVLDATGDLRETSHRTQQPAVSKGTLLDITRLDQNTSCNGAIHRILVGVNIEELHLGIGAAAATFLLTRDIFVQVVGPLPDNPAVG